MSDATKLMIIQLMNSLSKLLNSDTGSSQSAAQNKGIVLRLMIMHSA